MGSAIVEQLEKLKGAIEEAKTDKAKIEGWLQSYFKRLEEEFGIKSLEEGVEKLKVLQEELRQMEAEVERDFAVLKENYSW